MAEFITAQMNDGKTPEQATNALDFAAWAALPVRVEAPLAYAAHYGAEEIVASIGVDLPDGTPEIDSWKIAQSYARERGAEMVGMKWVDDELVPNPDAKWQITEGTRDMLRETVERGIKEGLTTDELKQLIMDSHSFSERRANMIARTEIRMARAAGSYDAAVEMGCTHKRWTTAKDDKVSPECTANGKQKPIPIDAPFPSGDMHQPAHPHCRCVVNYLFGKDDGEDDGKDAVAKGFNPNQPRDAKGRFVSIGKIVAFATRAASAGNVHEKQDIGAVKNSAKIKDSTGISTEGYRQKLDNFGVRHAFKHHGNEKIEAARGQRAVTAQDVARIPAVVHSPDSMAHGGVTKQGREVIQFEKTFGKETMHYRAEVRPKHSEIATLTYFVSVKK